MTSMKTVQLVMQSYREQNTTGWTHEEDGPFERYILDIGSGWRLRSDFSAYGINVGYDVYHPGEVTILTSIERMRFTERGIEMIGAERNVRVPITSMDPDDEGIPPLTEEAKDALIDLAMGGGYREVEEGMVIPLDGGGDLTLTIIRRRAVCSMPQVICRVRYIDPEGRHPDFDFIGRLRIDEGRVTVRHWNNAVSFDIPHARVVERLDEVHPRVPMLREWLRDQRPIVADERLSSMRDDMREALEQTGYDEEEIVYV